MVLKSDRLKECPRVTFENYLLLRKDSLYARVELFLISPNTRSQRLVFRGLQI
jgi:hypothetical protein